MNAYDACHDAEWAMVSEVESYADYEQELEDYSSRFKERGTLSSLDLEQKKFLESLLYYLLRLMAGERVLKFSLYRGLADAAEEMLNSFADESLAGQLFAEQIVSETY